jgi:hypothetical protein
VKHRLGARAVSRETSLPDAKIPEYRVKDILDIDPAGQPAKRPGGQPQLLGDDVFPTPGALSQRSIQSFVAGDQRLPVTCAANQSWLRAKISGCITGYKINCMIHSFAR